MNRKKSLKQAFIKKYGENLNFSDKDMQQVMRKIESQRDVQPKRKFNAGPVLTMVFTPLVILILILSSSHLFKDSQDASKESKVTEPAIKSDRKLFGDVGIQKVIRDKKFTQINQTVEKNGIAFTIHEIMYDGTRLALVYSADKEESNQNDSKFPEFPLFRLTIDGKVFIDYSEGASYAGEKDKFLQEFHLYTDLPDRFQLDIDIMRFGEIEGPWSFHLPIEKIEEKYHAAPNKSAENGEISLTLNELSFASSATNLNIDISEPIEKQRQRGTDTYIFEIRDDQGDAIAHMTSGATGGGDRDGKFIENFNEYFEPVDKLPKSITITPYLEKRGKMDYVVMPLNQKLPFYLEQDQFGGIMIKKIKQKQGELWIYYEVQGVSENLRGFLDLKEKGTDKNIERYDNYEKNGNGYIAKYRTSLPLDNLIVSTPKRTITKIDNIKLNVEIN